MHIVITAEMLEAYGNLRVCCERFNAAALHDEPLEIFATGEQLLQVRIPKFLQCVPEKVREDLEYGNSNYLAQIKRSTLKQLEENRYVDVVRLNNIRLNI